MKTLYPAQRASASSLVHSLLKHGAALDSSQTGTGKTVVAATVAGEMNECTLAEFGVICPKIVIPHWEKELAEAGLTPLFILNYEKLRTGKTPFLGKRGKKIFKWNLPSGTMLIFDEVQKAKGPFTQNAQMLIAAKQQGLPCLMLSATACEDPTEMRAIGYALGLHNLNMTDRETGTPSWNRWMLQYGCWRDQWNNWRRGSLSRLAALNKQIYPDRAVKLTFADLPGAFTKNHVIVERLNFSGQKTISDLYEQAGLDDDEIVDRLLNIGSDDGLKLDLNILTEILRARQKVEAAKLPDLVDMVEDVLREKFSVIVFANFRDTIHALRDILHMHNPGVVIGGQPEILRRSSIDNFQNGQSRLILVNTAAGGTGVNLHDTKGDRPRMSFLSPTFNLKEHTQALGRAHRAGSKSPVTQRIIVAAGTIEEKILGILEEKRKSLDTLHARAEA